MKQKKNGAEVVYVSVKIKKETVDKVRENKKKTYIPIGIFFEKAAEKELQNNHNQ